MGCVRVLGFFLGSIYTPISYRIPPPEGSHPTEALPRSRGRRQCSRTTDLGTLAAVPSHPTGPSIADAQREARMAKTIEAAAALRADGAADPVAMGGWGSGMGNGVGESGSGGVRGGGWLHVAVIRPPSVPPSISSSLPSSFSPLRLVTHSLIFAFSFLV